VVYGGGPRPSTWMASSGGDPSGLAAAGELALSLAIESESMFFSASLQSINPSEHDSIRSFSPARASSISAPQDWASHPACEPTHSAKAWMDAAASASCLFFFLLMNCREVVVKLTAMRRYFATFRL
jgi:hypothetical protein